MTVNHHEIQKAINRCVRSLNVLAGEWREELKEDFVSPKETDLESEIKGVLLALQHYNVFAAENYLTEAEALRLINKSKEFGKVTCCTEEEVDYINATGYLIDHNGRYITIGGYRILV